MEDQDFSLLRLQYEILNVSIESIARRSNLNPELLKALAIEEEWEHKWIDPDDPEPESDLNPDSDFPEDELTIKSEEFIERSKKRLAAYTIAKNVLMTQQYLELELSLVRKTIEHLENMPAITSKDLQSISHVYRNLLNGTPIMDILAMRDKQEDGGIPLLVVKDLAGA